MSEKSKKFMKALGVRAVKTFFQAGVAAVGSATLMSQVDWPTVASTAVLAAALSIATSFATGLPEA